MSHRLEPLMLKELRVSRVPKVRYRGAPLLVQFAKPASQVFSNRCHDVPNVNEQTLVSDPSGIRGNDWVPSDAVAEMKCPQWSFP